jgi:hypothetical protein
MQGLGPICILYWVATAQVMHVDLDFKDKFSVDWVFQINFVVKKHLLPFVIESIDLLVKSWQDE